MADVQPFRGLRPRPDLVLKVASPPYDVVTTGEARALAKGNPHSFLRVIRSEIDLDPGADPHGDPVYRRARDNLQKMILDGVLVRDETECLYLYRLTSGGHVQHGLVMGASVDEYADGRIKKHEHTRPDKEDDRARHVMTLQANTGPVLLTYRARDDIGSLVQKICAGGEPVYDFTAEDGVGHTLWVVSAPGDIERLGSAFAAVETLYIADGHHRAASACRVRQKLREGNPQHTGAESYNRFLAVAFPHDEMRILGYHRVVRDLGEWGPKNFLKRVAEDFLVGPADTLEPGGPGRFGMLLDGDRYRLEARGKIPPTKLDASILQEKLLGPVLGIADPRTDGRIGFVGGGRGIGELERRCRQDMRLAFTLHPVSVEQLMAAADRGETLPPKSTWFEPKLRSGIVVMSIE
jgi:uncharacterized protein (DUF1015 family)